MRYVFFLLSAWIACSPGERDNSPQQKELRTPTTETTYGLSDGFGYVCSIFLKSDGSFSFQWMSDIGPVAKADGKYELQLTTVRFMLKSNDFRQDPVAFSPLMHRIRWGKREYLIPQERLLDFVNVINAGREPRNHGMGVFYLRRGDELNQASGFPELPGPWHEYLLREPVEGGVIAVNQKETSTQRPIAIIDRGTSSGLREGMKLFASNPKRPNFRAYLTITAVQEDSATVVVPFQYNHIRKGDRVTSREPAMRPAN